MGLDLVSQLNRMEVYIYIYIYIYMCVCVCVCVCIRDLNKFSLFSNRWRFKN